MKPILRLILIYCLFSQVQTTAFAAPPAADRASGADFSGWHLPLPAGQWTISRGPCGSAVPYNHACNYYEDQCGLDLTPVSGSMENVPVLAPQSGRVFFLGTRFDAGLAVMLRHADGRLSALFHLSKAVVGLDQFVGQGQVIGYAGGTGSASKPHLHFHVQWNAVERNCIELKGLDDLDYLRTTAVSRNRAWTELTLPDPPKALPDWLPFQLPTQPLEPIILPARLVLTPSAQIYLPLAIVSTDTTENLITDGTLLKPTRRTANQILFTAPIIAPSQGGYYEKTFWPMVGAQRGAGVTLGYVVRLAPDTTPGRDMILVNPAFAGPTNWATLSLPPRLCWWEDASAGKSPLRFRVLVVGPTAADSGWITDTCWQTPSLKTGTYFWKVFVRDARGYMNRTNQRPYAFMIQ